MTPPEEQRPVSPSRRSADEASPFANVRELHAAEVRIGKALREMETRITKAIDLAIRAADTRHADTHADMAYKAAERHRPLDELLLRTKREDEEEKIERARRSGVREALLGAWRVVAVLDDHWRLVLLFVGLILGLLGTYPHIEVGVLPPASNAP